MSDLMLAKSKLPNDWIDLGIGEAKILKDIISRLHSIDSFSFSKTTWEYPGPNGWAPLVSHLEDMYSAPVIITTGAKQALCASFHVLKKHGYNKLGFRKPYWSSFPHIANHVGIGYHAFDDSLYAETEAKVDSYLLTLPNNPDGFTPSFEDVRKFKFDLKNKGIPLIHDAAYYTRTYLSIDYPTDPIGDMQLFSFSKAYGLSGLRLGYIVCNNKKYYRDLAEYMETATVGTSVASQEIMLHILKREEEFPFLHEYFEKHSREELCKAKRLLKKLNKDLVIVQENCERTPGMFAWLKPNDPELFNRAKVNVIPGELFGVPGMVRMNLAANYELIEEAIRRVNNG